MTNYPAIATLRIFHLASGKILLYFANQGYMAQSITLFEDKPLSLALGGELSPVQVAYQTYGTLNAEKNNAILLCHALTGDAEPALSGMDKGWWQDFIGPNLAFDTNKYFLFAQMFSVAVKAQRAPLHSILAQGNLTAANFLSFWCKIL